MAARSKLAGLESLDKTIFGSFAVEIEIAKAEITTLEDKLGAAGEGHTASEAAPGVESGILSKMTAILSKHQKVMATEEQEHTLLIAALEAQAAEIQVQVAEEHKLQAARLAANEELLVALQTKADQPSVSVPPLKASEASAEEAKQQLHAQLQKKFTHDWLGHQGLGHLTEPALHVLFAQYNEALKAAGPEVRKTLLEQCRPPSTIGEKKRRAGQMERWANDGEAEEEEDGDCQCNNGGPDEAEQSQQHDDRDAQRSEEEPDHQSRAAVARARKADVAALFASLPCAKTIAGNKNAPEESSEQCQTATADAVAEEEEDGDC